MEGDGESAQFAAQPFGHGGELAFARQDQRKVCAVEARGKALGAMGVAAGDAAGGTEQIVIGHGPAVAAVDAGQIRKTNEEQGTTGGFIAGEQGAQACQAVFPVG